MAKEQNEFEEDKDLFDCQLVEYTQYKPLEEIVNGDRKSVV